MANSRHEITRLLSRNACSVEVSSHPVCSHDVGPSETSSLSYGPLNSQVANSPWRYGNQIKHLALPTTTQQHGSSDYSSERVFEADVSAALPCEPSSTQPVERQRWQGRNAGSDSTRSTRAYTPPSEVSGPHDDYSLFPEGILAEQNTLPSQGTALGQEAQGAVETASDQGRPVGLPEATAIADIKEESVPSQPSEQDDDDSQKHAQEIAAEPCYAQLLRDCLTTAPSRTLALKTIYDWFMIHCKKAKYSKSMGWKNSIRHNLSMNDVSAWSTLCV